MWWHPVSAEAQDLDEAGVRCVLAAQTGEARRLCSLRDDVQPALTIPLFVNPVQLAGIASTIIRATDQRFGSARAHPNERNSAVGDPLESRAGFDCIGVH